LPPTPSRTKNFTYLCTHYPARQISINNHFNLKTMANDKKWIFFANIKIFYTFVK
jgi:hypothetical protein